MVYNTGMHEKSIKIYSSDISKTTYDYKNNTISLNLKIIFVKTSQYSKALIFKG